MLNGRLYDAATLNETVTGNRRRQPYYLGADGRRRRAGGDRQATVTTRTDGYRTPTKARSRGLTLSNSVTLLPHRPLRSWGDRCMAARAERGWPGERRTTSRIVDVERRRSRATKGWSSAAPCTFRGAAYIVPVINISSRGTMIESDLEPRLGESVIIRFEGCSPIYAFVRWARDGRDRPQLRLRDDPRLMPGLKAPPFRSYFATVTRRRAR